MTGTTHECPAPWSFGLMPCCGLLPSEVPQADRTTEDPALVTCGSDLT